MIKIAVCDDMEADAKTISETLREIFPEGLKLRQYSSAESFKNAAESGEFKPDIAFLDILLSDKNGIDLAQEINRCCPDCSIVFISSYIDFALDVYRSEHSYFILKSQLKQRIGPALEKVIEDKLKARPFLSYKYGSVVNNVPLKDILYIERNLKKTIIYLCSGKSCECREKPQNLLNDMKRMGFIQCHQSYYVNLEHVRQMKNSSFILTDGSIIPISRRLQPQTKEAFFQYISSPDEYKFI